MRKGSIAGPAFKIPFMGPFLQALHPRFDSYLAQWASGPLSCVSVFHKSVSHLDGLPVLCLSFPQIRRSGFRSRFGPQSLQVTGLRKAMHRSYRSGHNGS
jgi:hypothetical protein